MKKTDLDDDRGNFEIDERQCSTLSKTKLYQLKSALNQLFEGIEDKSFVSKINGDRGVDRER